MSFLFGDGMLYNWILEPDLDARTRSEKLGLYGSSGVVSVLWRVQRSTLWIILLLSWIIIASGLESAGGWGLDTFYGDPSLMIFYQWMCSNMFDVSVIHCSLCGVSVDAHEYAGVSAGVTLTNVDGYSDNALLELMIWFLYVCMPYYSVLQRI